MTLTQNIDTHNPKQRERTGFDALARYVFLLVELGLTWGWVWFIMYHTVPYFFVIAPWIDVIMHGLVGLRIGIRVTCCHVTRMQRWIVAIAGIVLFYIGDHVIVLDLVAGTGPLSDARARSSRIAFEVLALIVAAVASSSVSVRMIQRTFGSRDGLSRRR